MKTIFLRENVLLATPSVATVGCFDGVHRGHQVLIGRVLEKARQTGLQAMVITFDRQPRQLFDPAFRPQLLSTLTEKQAAMASLGVDVLVVLPFTRELASLTARQFMEQVLRDRLAVRSLVTGYDNRFGHNREEGFDDYVRYGQALGIEVLRGDVAHFPDAGQAVSSSAIRRLLLAGDVSQAVVGLTRPYQLSGVVVPGEHIGHELGFPTANLTVGDSLKLIPAPGVYAVWAEIGQRRFPAMMNIGTRPTFEGHRQTLEVNIFGFEGDLYGQPLAVHFIERLRDERRFDTPDALVAQLEADKAQATRILEHDPNK